MKSLFVFFVLLPSIALGQTLGCYVLNTNCYAGTSGSCQVQCSTMPIYCSSNYALVQMQYGLSIANLCEDYYEAKADVLACQISTVGLSVYNTLVDKHNALVDQFNTLSTAYDGLVTINASSRGLIKRLRRKCGKACKRIK